MSLTAIFLVLSAAVAHAAWNVLAHQVSRIGLPFLWWGAVSSTLLWIGVVPLTGGLGAANLRSFVLGVGVSAVLHVAYMLVLQKGYRVGDLSTVYATARGSGPIISVVVAITLLGERPAPAALGGVALVIAGVLMIGAADRTPVAAGAPRSPRSVPPGLLFGLLTGAAIAAYTVWDAHAVRSWQLSPVAFMVGCTLVEIPLFSLALRRRGRELVPVLREHWPRLLAFGALSPLSYILVLVAVTLAPVALVAPMREVSVVLVSVYGGLVLHERRARWRIAASVVVVAGIVLIAV